MLRTFSGWICAIATAVAAALVVAAGAAFANDPVVTGVRLGVDPSRTRIVVESDQRLDTFVFTLAEHSPRVVIEFARADFAMSGRELPGGQFAGAGAGLIEQYRYAQFSPTRSRIVLDLEGPARIVREFSLDPEPEAPRHRYVLDLAPTDAASFAADAGFSLDQAPAARPEVHQAVRQSDRLPIVQTSAAAGAGAQGPRVVVIDAGHGGRDHGASSSRGAREKDVNLALARDIRDALEALGGYDVVMTRDDDRFIELEDRLDVALRIGADLFLSVHADSGPNDPTARGAAVYTLSDEAERRIEDEVIREDPALIEAAGGRAEVIGIVASLRTRLARNESTAFAEILIPHLQDVGPLLRNTHRQRGFYVLLNPDMPAVLLEAGFLTNAEDERRLTSPADRATLAAAVAAGVDDYFAERERLYASNATR